MIGAIVAKLLHYAPMAKDVTITVHFVAGGVSDGFLLENDPNLEFFIALGKGEQDLSGLKLNITHEAFHAVQKALGRNRRGMTNCVNDPNAGPLPLRMICTTLLEGTATFVADATKSRARGPYIDMWRSRYERNLTQNALADGFALFDRLLADLQDRSITWNDAYAKAFTPPNTPAYFVGYEMARAIARYDGPAAIGALFEAAPADFFREYIRLYHSHPELRFRFSPGTERLIESSSVNASQARAAQPRTAGSGIYGFAPEGLDLANRSRTRNLRCLISSAPNPQTNMPLSRSKISADERIAQTLSISAYLLRPESKRRHPRQHLHLACTYCGQRREKPVPYLFDLLVEREGLEPSTPAL